MEQRIGEAVIVDWDCDLCKDSGIIQGIAELDGDKVIIGKLCECILEKLKVARNDNRTEKQFDSG